MYRIVVVYLLYRVWNSIICILTLFDEYTSILTFPKSSLPGSFTWLWLIGLDWEIASYSKLDYHCDNNSKLSIYSNV